jgi:type I restriction enzyme S subunit
MSELLTKGTDETEFKDSKLGRIPTNWEITSLNQNLELLTDFEANGSFADVKSNVRVFSEPNYAWYVRATDLEKKTPLSNVKYVDKETYEFLRKTTLIDKEVLIAKRGEIGKVYFFRNAGVPATAAPNTYVLRLKKSLDPFYLYCYLTSPFGNQRLKRINASTTIGALYKDDVKKFKLPTPPLPEQKKIASILTSVDEVIENTQKQIDKLQDLKKATMSELLTKGIGHTEFKDSELGQIPKSWEVGRFDDFITLQRGHDLPTQNRKKGVVPIFGSNGIVGLHNNSIIKETGVITGRSGSIGEVHFVKGLYWALNTTLYVKDFHGNDAEFISHYLKFFDLERFATGTGVPTLNRNDVHNQIIKFPPFEEQLKICDAIGVIESRLELILMKLSQAQSLKKSLMQDLLTGKVRVTVN